MVVMRPLSFPGWLPHRQSRWRSIGLGGDGSAHSHEGHGPTVEGQVQVLAHQPNIEAGPGGLEKPRLRG